MRLHGIWLSICIIAALVVGFGVYGWQQRRVGAQNALAKQQAARLDSAIALQQQKDAERAQQDSVAQAKISALTLAGKTLQVKASQLNAHADSLVALDSLKPAIEMLRNVISVDSVIIAQQAQAIGILTGRWQAADSSAQAWKALALNAQGQLAASLKRGAPRFSCGPGAGFTVGLGGSAAGATFACTIRL